MSPTQSTMVPLQFMTGAENHQRKSCRLNAYVSERMGDVFFNKYPGAVRLQPPTKVPAVQFADPDICGSWQSHNYQFPEGTIFKLWREHVSSGVRDFATVYLRLSAQAPLYSMSCDLIGESYSTVSKATVTGRFTRLTYLDAIRAGCFADPRYAAQASEGVFARLFTLQQIAPGLVPAVAEAPKPVLNSEGARSLVSVPLPTRILE